MHCNSGDWEREQLKRQEGNIGQKNRYSPSPNTAYTLRAKALALRDIALGNIVYAGNVI